VPDDEDLRSTERGEDRGGHGGFIVHVACASSGKPAPAGAQAVQLSPTPPHQAQTGRRSRVS
jgi:hypothetical protein